MVYDAGDTLEVLQRCNVNLVLSGHKHVPHAWHFENMFVVNAGTVCSLRLRGDTRPCYNIVTIDDDHVRVERKYPFHGTRDDHRVLALDAALPEVRRPARRAPAAHVTPRSRGRRRTRGLIAGRQLGSGAAAPHRDRADRRRALPAGRDRRPARARGALRVRGGRLSGRRREAARAAAGALALDELYGLPVTAAPGRRARGPAGRAVARCWRATRRAGGR